MGYPNQRPNPDKRLEREKKQKEENLKKVCNMFNNTKTGYNPYTSLESDDYSSVTHNTKSPEKKVPYALSVSYNNIQNQKSFEEQIDELMEKRKGNDDYQNIHDTKYIYEILGKFSLRLFKVLNGLDFCVNNTSKNSSKNKSKKGKFYIFLYEEKKVQSLRYSIENTTTQLSPNYDWLIPKIKMKHSLTLVEMSVLANLIPPEYKQKITLSYHSIDEIIKKMGNTFYHHTEHFQKVRHLAIFACEQILKKLNNQREDLISKNEKDVRKKVLLHLIHLYPYQNEEFRRNKYYSKYLKLGGDIESIKQDPKDYGKFYEQNKVLESYSDSSKFDNFKLTYSSETSDENLNSSSGQLSSNISTEPRNIIIDSIDRLYTITDGVIWKNIPKFSILTGKNGSGKTRVLNSIYQELKSSKEHKDYLYMNSEATMLRNVFGQNGSDFKYEYVRNGLKWYFDHTDMKQREKVFSKKSLDRNINDKIALAIADEYFCGDYTIENISKVEDSKIRQTAERLAFSEGSIIEPISFARNLCWQYHIYIYQDYKDSIIDMRKDLNNKYKNQLYDEFKTCFKEYEKLRIDYDKKLSEQNDNIIHPTDNINRLLRRYLPDFSVKYQLDENKWIKESWILDDNSEKDKYEGYELLFFKNNMQISINDLSSGELVVIKLIFWSYVSKGLDFEKRKNEGYRESQSNIERKEDYNSEDSIQEPSSNIKLLLLDEIDKHFDPKLTKVALSILQNEFSNSQIIMTTHRIDTISLIPQDLIDNKAAKIFTIKNKKSVNSTINTEMKGEQDREYTKEIVPITKLEAMYRLTKNLRQFTGHRFEVCTEGFYDAYFYSGVYHSLLDMSKNTQRDKSNDYPDLLTLDIMPKNLYAIDVDTGEKQFIGRALSERYQMFFRGVSLVKNGNPKSDGGCAEVTSMIGRDYTTFEYGKKNSEELFANKEFHVPYGIVDADARCFKSPESTTQDADEKYIEDRIVYPKDFFSDQKLGSRYSIENFLFDPLVLCSTLDDSEIQKFVNSSLIADGFRDKMKEVCNHIKSCTQSVQLLQDLNIQQALDAYFDIVFNTLLNTVLDIKFDQLSLKLNKRLGKEKGIKHYDRVKQHNSIIKQMVTDIVVELEELTSAIIKKGGSDIIANIEEKSKPNKKANINTSVKFMQKSIRKFINDDDQETHNEIFKSEVEYHMFFDKNNFKNDASKRPMLSIEKKDFIKNNLRNTLKHPQKGYEFWQLATSETDVIEDENNKQVKYKKEQKEVLKKIAIRHVENIKPKIIKFLFKFEDKVFLKEFEYPEMFLQFRGHYIEDYCFGHDVADAIAMKVKTKGLDVIPLDLAQVFFDLNHKIRSNVRDIIKPDFNNKSPSPVLPGNDDPDHSDRNKMNLPPTDIHINTNGEKEYIAKKIPDLCKLDLNDKVGEESIIRSIDQNKIIIKGDGDCLFNSILVAMKLKEIYTNIQSQQDIRDKLAVYYEEITEDAILTDIKEIVKSDIKLDRDIRYYQESIRNKVEENKKSIADCNRNIDELSNTRKQFSSDTITYKVINNTINQMCEERNKIIEDVIGTDEPKKLYASKIQKGAWGSDVDVQCLATLLNIKIHITNSADNSITIHGNGVNEIFIIYNGSDHYDVSTIGLNLNELEQELNPVITDNLISSDYILADEQYIQLKYYPYINNKIWYVNSFCYNSPNPILRQDELLHQAGQVAGIDGINRLIDLGEQGDDVAREIIAATRDYGIKQVLDILLSDIKKSLLSTSMILQTDVKNANVDTDYIKSAVEKSDNNTARWVDRCSNNDISLGCFRNIG